MGKIEIIDFSGRTCVLLVLFFYFDLRAPSTNRRETYDRSRFEF